MNFEEIEDDYVTFTAPRSAKLALDNNFKPAKQPSKIKIRAYLQANRYFSIWGENDNLWPELVNTLLQGCAPARVAVEILATTLYGNGIRVYERDAKGNQVTVWDPDQMKWFRQVNISQYMMAAAVDYFQLANQFPQLIRNKAKTGFAYIANISAPWCRYSKYDLDLARLTDVFIFGTWNMMPSEEEVDKVPLLNPFDATDEVAPGKGGFKYMWPVFNYTPGNLFYHEHAWHALVRTGALDIFPEIPKIKKNKIKNAMFVKYHIRINELYWYLQYGGFEKGKQVWEGMTAKERKEARKKKYHEIDTQLCGSENAFKSIFSPTYVDPRTGVEVKLLTIEKIETEVGEKGTFDPDKMSSVTDIFLAFNIPSAIANTVLNDQKSRGGGSDIREAQTILVSRMAFHRDNLLAPVDFAMRNTFINNGKDEPLLKPNQYLGCENMILTTLDANTSGVQILGPDGQPAPDEIGQNAK